MDRFRTFKIAASLLVIFGGGAVTGILLDRHYTPRTSMRQRAAAVPPAERPEVLLKEFTAAMHLTPEQQQRVGGLLRDWGKEMAGHPEWNRAQRASFVESNSPLLRTNLTAEQSAIYDRILERIHRRRPR
jgi:hypothetical protein